MKKEVRGAPGIGSASSEQQTKKKKGGGHTRARLPLIPLDMPGRYYTGNVMAVSGWSRMKLWRRIKLGKFPEPQKDGDLNYWSTDVVRKALGL